MVEEIAPHLYRILIPLPASLLGSVNAYVVKGEKRSLIVDTGMNLDACMKAMEEGLRKIGVDTAESDFFITHSHPDHIDLLPRLIRDGSIVYIDRTEAARLERLRSGAMFADFRNMARVSGFPETDLARILPDDIIRPSKAKRVLPYSFVEDGGALEVGEYRFRLIATPGHSHGHFCLYEPTTQLFLAGDHILSDITPGIQARSEAEDPLSAYLRSLDAIYPLQVRLVLPGHRQPFATFKERIDELKEHHRERASEIMRELEQGPKTIYEVASAITWNVVDSDSWGSVPDLQKLLATGEVFAHMNWLERRQMVHSEMREEKMIFFLT